MPAYNAERYLDQAVHSILDQTFMDFELIIVDDGSTDNTRSILERIAARDSRVRAVSRPNTGYVVALNEMIGMARAPLLARMDADDVALPDRFERQVAFLEEHPEVVAVGSAVEIIDYRGRFLTHWKPHLSNDELQAQALSGRTPLCHPSVMIRADAIRAIGGYRELYYSAEDLDLWLRLGEEGQLACLSEVLLRYRDHAKSISTQAQARQLELVKQISDEASARRGLPPQFVTVPPFRPIGRQGRYRRSMAFGWVGFHQGNWTMAAEYAARALWEIPWRSEGWLLLACAFLKSPKPAPGREAALSIEASVPKESLP
jgi:glycosyltransferase involved in cell wall biosynthesis